jgi:hypothetical protein
VSCSASTAGGQGVQARLLEGDADLEAHLVGALGDVEARDLGPPPARREQRREHANAGRLPCTVGPQEAEHLAGADLEIDASHRLDAPVERPAQPLCNDGCSHVISSL